jgi:hypothetical protein
VLLSVKFTKLISSGAKLSALGYGAARYSRYGARERSTCNAEEKGMGGEDVDKVIVIIIIVKLKVFNVNKGLTRAFFVTKK